MKEIEILSVGHFYAPSYESMERDFTVHKLWQAKDRAALLREVGGRVRALQTSAANGADAQLMDALPKIELISHFGVGVDSVDLAAARQRGLTVTNTPDVLNECVADLAMGLTLATLRRISLGDRFVRAGSWLKGALPLAQKVGGKTMGILGYGRIGKAIAKRAEAFGMHIVYHGRKPQPGAAPKYYARLADMARDCDVLMVICPGGAATHHMVDAQVLEALGPQGTLINVARGSVVDEPALVRALAEGKLGAAGLDVFEDEPRVPEALYAMDQVVLQPHVGSATHETRKAMGDLTVDNLRAHFAGKPVLTPVV
ncbi:MAG: 2-hydroxyacid dehydrogenase [Burkholderiales bacterium]|nr:2-hydroxyacid dehydrogenase [Burkholderiales bacterium]